MDFSSNFFDIFSIPVAWDIDINGLGIRYRALQQEFHPDRYATKTDVEKRLAVQSASLINQAFDTLKSPLKRAQYLLELNSVDANQEAHITTDAGFLMQQIELREALSGVSEKQDPWGRILPECPPKRGCGWDRFCHFNADTRDCSGKGWRFFRAL